MTPELRDKLLHFCNDNEPFLTHNYMRMTDADDGTATIVLPMQENSLNRWGGWTAWAESWPSAPPRSPTKRGKWWCAPTR